MQKKTSAVAERSTHGKNLASKTKWQDFLGGFLTWGSLVHLDPDSLAGVLFSQDQNFFDYWLARVASSNDENAFEVLHEVSFKSFR